MDELTLALLGPPQIHVDGATLKVDTRKATALLIYLAVEAKIQRRESLATMFWPESDSSHAKAALRRTLSALRKALGGNWLEATRETLSLEYSWLDTEVFTEMVESTRQHDHDTRDSCQLCIQPLTSAVELYRDDFLAGFTLADSPDFDDWQYFQSQALQRRYSEALNRLTSAHARQKEFDQAIEYANRRLNIDVLNESAHRELMALYARVGQREQAMRQYRDCVRILQEELGAPPLDETIELHERIAAGELTEPSMISLAALGEGPPEPTDGIDRLPLVGRGDEFRRMESWYAETKTRTMLGIIAGEPGVGKSRMAEEFLDSLASTQAVCLRARSYPDEQAFAYRPWIEALREGLRQHGEGLQELAEVWLSEASRLLPELSERFPDLPRLEQVEGPSGQDRFLESLRRVTGMLVAGGRPGVIYLDDLHWADEASIEYLSYLMRRGSEQPLLMLAAWRTEVLADEQRLQALIARLPSDSARSIQLERLTEGEVATLVQQLGIASPRVGRRLYAETEGLPLFLAEYLQALAAESGEIWEVPAPIRHLLSDRVNQLSGARQQLLSAAAVIGRSFEYETLRVTSGRSAEETVAGLEELLSAGLVREYREDQPPLGPTYDFVHEKLREVALQTTAQARQRLLHGRVAKALLRLRGSRHTGPLAGRIARHLEQSGEAATAAQFYQQAGDHARSVFANEQALAHYRSALALGNPDPGRLHEAIGDLHTLAGSYEEAAQEYEAAAAYAENGRTAAVEHKLGGVYHRWGQYERAANHLRTAADATEDLGWRARVYADWSLNAHREGEAAEADKLIEQGIADAQAAEDPSALAQCENILGILARSTGDLTGAREHLQRSLDHAETLGEPGAKAAAQNNLALVLAEDGQLEQALELAREALEISKALGDRHREAALHSNLADMLHRMGDEQRAQDHLTRSAAIFADVGGAFEPEIWKLVEW
jgi:predicted ATPase/DNA-binding SARP family transcriptional activator